MKTDSTETLIRALGCLELARRITPKDTPNERVQGLVHRLQNRSDVELSLFRAYLEGNESPLRS